MKFFKCNGRTRVWTQSNNEFHFIVKHSDGSVLVLGCMTSTDVVEMVFINGVLDRYVYFDILQYFKKM